jgi:hypothetical protein
MKFVSKATLLLSLVLCAALSIAAPASAQTVTTGALSGTVVDPQGGALPGATVVATHVPTGTKYEGVTMADGKFILQNVQVGGPYVVEVTMSGFKKYTEKDLVVNLGEERTVPVKLALDSVAEEVTVSAVATSIDVTRAGTAANISNMVKEALPTINRSLIDIVRTNPYFNAITTNNTVTAVSVAGRNARYNSIQIDGAVNNDLFGLAETGTPGGQTESQPISLDAIAQIQLVVSPYDVRQGGFSGGGINAVTKSGSNQLSGTAFYFGRNQDWVGKGVTNTAIANFSDKQGGGSVGGKLLANKAFFFANADYGRKETPTGFCIEGCGQVFRGTAAEVDRFLSILQNKYGYSVPNAKAEYSRTTNSDKILGKVDFNLNSSHRLTLRHNFVNGLNDIAAGVGTSSTSLPDGFYRFKSKTNGSVVQLNSTFGTSVNEFRVAYTRIRDRRGAQPFETKPFPRVSVRMNQGSTNITLSAGREAFSTANELDQDIVELHDDYTMLKGQHTITVGTHNEFFHFRNLFIRDNFGTYTFNTLDFFDQGLAQQFDYSYPTNPSKPDAKFGVRTLGFYVGDQWRAASNLTITTGVRVDVPMFPDKPTANPVAVNNFGYATDVTPGGVRYSPRIGFNWDLSRNGDEQIRGGVGMFSGRTPYVWLSNQYGNTGIEFQRIGASNSSTNRIPFVADPANQPKTVTGASGSSFTNEIDLIDPDYKYPTLLRGNLAYERKLFGNLVASTEFVYTKNIQDVKYQNLNRDTVAAGAAGRQNLDGRPIYTRDFTTLGDVIFLTNSDGGEAWSGLFELRRPFRGGWFFNASYLYGKSTATMEGTSSQAASNWGNVLVAGDPNNPPVGRSVYDPGHRVNFSASKEMRLFGGVTGTASLYYSGQSGRPFTLTHFGDVNGDGRTSNDLLYIPASASEVTFTGGTYQQFLNFLQEDGCLDDYVGKIIPRNVCRAPWSNQVDFRFNVALPFQRIKAEISLDILNVLNLLQSKWGIQEYATFNAISPVTPVLTSGQITGYNISFMTNSSFRKWQRDDLRSRWQMQLGGRIRF